jgi:hypothetical protein
MGNLTLSIARGDAILLPRLFAAIERARRGLIREWSLSNTTLEQVFLQLCLQNTTVNYAPERQDVSHDMCPMCRMRRREPTLLRTLAGVIIVVPDSLCQPCASGASPSYAIEEGDGVQASGDRARTHYLLTHAQRKAVMGFIEDLPILPVGVSAGGEGKHSDEENQHQNQQDIPPPPTPDTDASIPIPMHPQQVHGQEGQNGNGSPTSSPPLQDVFSLHVVGSPSTQVNSSSPCVICFVYHSPTITFCNLAPN